MLELAIILLSIAAYLIIGFIVANWFCADEETCSAEQEEELCRWMVLLTLLWPVTIIAYIIISSLERIEEKNNGV